MTNADADVLIIVATYNERENLPVLIRRVMPMEVGADLLVVDDASPDGTGEIAEELAREYPGRIHVTHRRGKLGYASALREGFRFGLQNKYPIIMTMDADLSHDPEKMPELYAATEDADVVIGSRYVPGGGTENWPWYRRALSRTASVLARLMTGLQVRDCTGGFRAYRREIIAASGMLDSSTEGYSFLVEALYKCQKAGAKIIEVPITFADRQRGASKISKRIIFEAGWLLCKLTWHRLIHQKRQAGGGKSAVHTEGEPPEDGE